MMEEKSFMRRLFDTAFAVMLAGGISGYIGATYYVSSIVPPPVEYELPFQTDRQIYQPGDSVTIFVPFVKLRKVPFDRSALVICEEYTFDIPQNRVIGSEITENFAKVTDFLIPQYVTDGTNCVLKGENSYEEYLTLFKIKKLTTVKWNTVPFKIQVK